MVARMLSARPSGSTAAAVPSRSKVAAWALWKLLRRQEDADPDFERTLQADERRARGNRQAAARASLEHDEAVKAQRAAQGTTPPNTPAES
jgi:hypothetical protein